MIFALAQVRRKRRTSGWFAVLTEKRTDPNARSRHSPVDYRWDKETETARAKSVRTLRTFARSIGVGPRCRITLIKLLFDACRAQGEGARVFIPFSSRRMLIQEINSNQCLADKDTRLTF